MGFKPTKSGFRIGAPHFPTRERVSALRKKLSHPIEK